MKILLIDVDVIVIITIQNKEIEDVIQRCMIKMSFEIILISLCIIIPITTALFLNEIINWLNSVKKYMMFMNNICGVCNREFASISSLQAHVDLLHKNKDLESNG